jgi:hypothetical protein
MALRHVLAVVLTLRIDLRCNSRRHEELDASLLGRSTQVFLQGKASSSEGRDDDIHSFECGDERLVDLVVDWDDQSTRFFQTVGSVGCGLGRAVGSELCGTWLF